MRAAIPLVALAGALVMTGLAAPLAAEPAPLPPRARGPALAVAVALAQDAIRTCLGHGYKTTALVVDSAGVPVAMLSADGAAEITQEIARRKVAVVIRYKVPSGVIAQRLKDDPALAAEVKADPKMGFAFAGGLPLIVDGVQIGAFAVSGASGPDEDEACASAALASIDGALR